ncbi:hypothetical protein N7535_001011 [Penicillium sp. DV-2018c]|nr:hypothetical protein N7461_005745 [Penicillium sp. DV-2018c]KAJ5582391.1 hypothetical protein N7535_001011 [Penicillium sp. DV-2018c]
MVYRDWSDNGMPTTWTWLRDHEHLGNMNTQATYYDLAKDSPNMDKLVPGTLTAVIAEQASAQLACKMMSDVS